MKNPLKTYAEKKAWAYFRELVNNDEKYFALKTKKEPIYLKGSDGGKYYLYPNGNIARLDKDKPSIGRLQFDTQMPRADFLATVYIWITKNEQLLKKQWQCGSLSVYYSRGEAFYEDGERIPPLTEVDTVADWFTGSSMDFSTMAVPLFYDRS